MLPFDDPPLALVLSRCLLTFLVRYQPPPPLTHRTTLAVPAGPPSCPTLSFLSVPTLCLCPSGPHLGFMFFLDSSSSFCLLLLRAIDSILSINDWSGKRERGGRVRELEHGSAKARWARSGEREVSREKSRKRFASGKQGKAGEERKDGGEGRRESRVESRRCPPSLARFRSPFRLPTPRSQSLARESVIKTVM